MASNSWTYHCHNRNSSFLCLMNTLRHTILLNEGVARNPLVRLPFPANVYICEGEQIAILGNNGAGKSLLVDMLIGKSLLRSGTISYDFASHAENFANIKYIAFRDTFTSTDSCYQMRWNQTEQDDVPLVSEMIAPSDGSEWQNYLFSTFGISAMLEKKIVALSSGELRKFQLAKALLHHPHVLILDNPYIGLDSSARDLLTDVLSRLSSSIQMVLVLSRPDDIPPFITHVIPVEGGMVKTKQAYHHPKTSLPLGGDSEEAKILPSRGNSEETPIIIQLNNVSISYANHTILKPLTWTVRQGEKWALLGRNGSGKSTLLSLICADNPQAYACDISLFGHKRGSGESIWDIKKHIGYVSPEMHRSYLRNIPAVDIVASGLHDTIGLYTHTRPEDLHRCLHWMEAFGIADKQSMSFLCLSSGEQRLVLLARAFVKDPELLILDEPLHGLDTQNRNKVKSIIEQFSLRPGKTLIMVTHYPQELPSTFTHTLNLTTGTCV